MLLILLALMAGEAKPKDSIVCVEYYTGMKLTYSMKGVEYEEYEEDTHLGLKSTDHTRPWRLVFSISPKPESMDGFYVRDLGQCTHKGYTMHIFFLDPKKVVAVPPKQEDKDA